jgi:hypothetical protein
MVGLDLIATMCGSTRTNEIGQGQAEVCVGGDATHIAKRF